MAYLMIIASIFGVEYFWKNWVEKKYSMQTRKYLCKDQIILCKYHNKGAFLNLGERVRPFMAFLSFIFTGLMTVIFIGTLFTKGNHIMKLGLAFLLGGAFSNTYDRLSRKYVVDYISFACKSKRLSQIVYNISDFFIMIGSMLFVIASLIKK